MTVMVDARSHSWAVIDLQALRHNLSMVRQHAPGRRICAVVKANAYGHGVAPVATALRPVMQADDLFAVATLREAQTLRLQVPGTPILILRGPVSLEEMYAVLAQDFCWVLHSPWQLELLQQALAGATRPASACVKVWIKTNTGMNRLGLPAQRVAEMYQAIGAQGLQAQVVLMSHLATADDRTASLTQQQVQAFEQLGQALSAAGHELTTTLAASAGILGWPQSHADIVRPGIMLYGSSPMMGREGPDENLQPVMNLFSRLIAVNEVSAGDTVGYGATFTAPRAMRIGVIGLGYADGYPRHAPSGTPVVIHAQGQAYFAPLAGRVSMDMLTVDLTDVPAQAGDEVLLWGQAWNASLPADRIAALCQTIAYELFCQVTGRVEFIYR